MPLPRPEYRAWHNALRRCRPGGPDADCYYDRGIRVAPEWHGREGFARFLAHIGPRPSAAHSLDRADNDRGYEPGNVRWATRSEQRRNSRPQTARRLIDGVGVADFARALGVSRNTVYVRLREGRDVHAAPYARGARKAA